MTLPPNADEILSKYSNLASAAERPLFPKSLIYGRPKIGKTVTCCQVGDRPLLFSADPGWSSLKDWPELADRVTVENMKSIRHFELFVDALWDDLPRYREFDHILWDPINGIVMEYIDYLQDNYTPSTADSRVKWVPTKEGTAAGLEAFTTGGMGDYHAVRNWLRRPVKKVCKLDKMVTFVCHATEPGFTEAKGAPIRADLPKKTYQLLAAEVDLIGYMEAKGTEITISLSPSEKEDAGSRIRELHGKKIRATDYAKLIDKWRYNG